MCGALHTLGIPCIPILYPDGIPTEETPLLNNVRMAFCDLHLLAGAANTELNYPVIGALLAQMAKKSRSPLLLVLWTAYPQDADALRTYLAQRHAETQPIAILALDKANFDGEQIRNLPEAIREKLNSIPQLRALYEWEDDVASAGGACVGALLRLAATDGSDLTKSLDKLLSTLAQKATGKQLAAENPGAALHEALVPLLADKLSHLPDDTQRVERWKIALPSAASKKVWDTDPSRVAAINTALNVMRTENGSISGRERGAVIGIDCTGIFMYRFSSDQSEVLKKFFLKDESKYRWVAIQVEAACDFANQKSPCIPYVLATEVPASVELLEKHADSIWRSPIFLSEQNEKVRLVANVRYVAMISSKKTKSKKALYRLREPLVNELAFCKSRHETRPGIVAL
jgi:hypothetical protein